MSTELAITEQVITERVLSNLLTTTTLPDRYTNVGDAIATILVGRELGMPPLTALNELYVVNGSVGMTTKAMAACVRRTGNEIRIVEQTPLSATAEAWAKRDDGTFEKVGTFTYTMEDARLAKLDGKPTYKKHPGDMLGWKAVARAVRFSFPDAIVGGFTDEPVEAIARGDGTGVDTMFVLGPDDDSEGMDVPAVAEYFDAEILDEETGEILGVKDGG